MNSELTILDLMNELPEFTATKSQMLSLLKESKLYKDVLVMEVVELKNGKYHIALWDKELYDEYEEEK
jgi:hypothetical protein